MEAFQAGGECVGEKLPLEGTLGFEPLQTIKPIEHTTGKGNKSIIGPL